MSQLTGIQAIVATDDPKLLVEEAETLAKRLYSDEASKTQLRRLYSTMKQIEMSWPRTARPADPEKRQHWEKERDDAYRELLLFRPRLAYQGERHPRLQPLVQVLQDGIKAVNKEQRESLTRLVQFFEATLAYYIAQPKAEPRRY